MARQVEGLAWARRLEGRPRCIPQSRPRGYKALGRRYENLVAKNLAGAEHGVWWEFRDANGPGWCQTDFIIQGQTWVAIFECKHTWCLEGMSQLHDLYMPVVGKALGMPTLGIQLCKNLVSWVPRNSVCESLEDAIEIGKVRGVPMTLHWRGFGPLTPSVQQPKPKIGVPSHEFA